ncbi:MAG: hypothetical protein LBP87_07275 [Planctomycetaceae bacterium]|nr:hypothetical protein [Planctomycetaceae bacterium]
MFRRKHWSAYSPTVDPCFRTETEQQQQQQHQPLRRWAKILRRNVE